MAMAMAMATRRLGEIKLELEDFSDSNGVSFNEFIICVKMRDGNYFARASFEKEGTVFFRSYIYSPSGKIIKGCDGKEDKEIDMLIAWLLNLSDMDKEDEKKIREDERDKVLAQETRKALEALGCDFSFLSRTPF